MPAAKTDRSASSWQSRFRASLLSVAAVAALVVLGGCGAIQVSFHIASCANYPTLKPGYHIILQKPAKTIMRGDFVVYHSPLVQTPGGTAVSRVVELPGETIKATGGRVMVNGELLPEQYLPPGTTTRDFGPVHVPPGQYFLLGDNRSNSADSRAFGPVSVASIVAKVTSIKKGQPSGNDEPLSLCQL